MSRYRLRPSIEQEAVLLRHCADARFMWNLAVEQQSHWRPGRQPAPGFVEQCRQLTAARQANPWLAGGSHMVQQQARSEEHTSELQSRRELVCRLLLEKKKR